MVILRESERQAFNVLDAGADGVDQKTITSLLLLGLDSEGRYFQRRRVTEGPDTTDEWGVAVYPEAAAQNLKTIPFEFIYSTERAVGDVPIQLGYIDPISSKAIHRYQVSALLKEALRITAQPTSYSKGWTAQSFELYKKATGREQIMLGAGAHIPLFGDAEAGFLDWNADSNGLFKYMAENKAQMIALGGVFNEESDSASTATAAAINSAEKKGVLSTLAKNIEGGYMRAMMLAGLYMGVELTDETSVKLSREFSAASLSAQDRAAIVAEYNAGLISHPEALRQLEEGGVLAADVARIFDELETGGSA